MIKVKKKILSLAMSAAMVTSLFAGMTISASATETVSTQAQLAAMTSGNYVLGANITIDASTWTPISNFTGTFDGDSSNYKITWDGDTVTGQDRYGIFGTSSGTIQDLKVEGSVTVTGNYKYVSPIVGYNSGSISGVTNTAAITAVNSSYVGGIAGFNNGCYDSNGNVVSSGVTGSISGSANYGEIDGYTIVGGITGENSASLTRSFNVAYIHGNRAGKSGIGGITGRNGDTDTVETGTIANCYNWGRIVSGLEGRTADQGSWVGGISGFQNNKSSSTNCYNTGVLIGYAFRDHTAGKNENSNGVSNCYGIESGTNAQWYDGTVSRSDNVMKTSAFLTALAGSTTDIWTQENNKYPVLVSGATGDFGVLLVSLPTKLTYTEGEAFDASGMQIKARYGTESETAVSSSYYTISANSSGTTLTSLTTSDNKITVSGTYPTSGKDFQFSFGITVGSRPSEVTLGPSSTSATYNDLASALNAVASGGKIKVLGTTSINLSESTQWNNDVTIEKSANFSGPMLTVNPGQYTLTMTTMKLSGGSYGGTLLQVTGGQVFLRGGITFKNGQGLKLTGGIVEVRNAHFENCITTDNGAAIDIIAGAVNMYGNTSITGGSAVNGGAVAVEANGSTALFTMNSGTIGGTGSDANSATLGGAVYVGGSGSTFTMNGGTITGNTAATTGAGVYVVHDSTFNLGCNGIASNQIVYLENTTLTNCCINLTASLSETITVQMASEGNNRRVATAATTTIQQDSVGHIAYATNDYHVVTSGSTYLVLSNA